MNRNITATILVVLSVGIYFTVTSGAWNDAMAVKAVNDQYSGAISSAKKLIAVRDDANKKYSSIDPQDQANLKLMLPSTVDNIRLIINLNNRALKYGLTLKNPSATANSSKTASNNAPGASSISGGSSPIIPAPTLDTVAVSFSVTASYQQFISFMQDLEANMRIMDITHLSLSANDTGTYDFSVQLNTYWLRQ